MINSKQRVGCPFGGFSIPVEFLDQMLPLPKRNDGKRKRVVFTKFDAYRDMLWRACEQEQGYGVRMAQEYHISAGQFVTTITELACAWGWHRDYVRALLDELEDDGHVEIIKMEKFFIITLCRHKDEIAEYIDEHPHQRSVEKRCGRKKKENVLPL